MSKYLVILESPNKVGKVKSFLGKDFDVTATKGHIRDLPEKKIGVNLKKDFEPTYEIYSDKKDIVKNILKMAKGKDIVYLMTDIDREGEYIGFHILSQLPEGTIVKRAKSGSITRSAVLKAIEDASDLDYNLVNSAETRRILDRLVGYKCSFITKQATGGTSAGRVQSATLRILADREKEIKDFIPKEYWPIEAVLERKNGERVTAKIKVPDKLKIKNKEEAEKICESKSIKI
jgi:DNA topoisomerase-1